MKLIGRANLFWEDLEVTFRRQHQPLITNWQEMKDTLSRNYLPLTYKSSLLDEWNFLRRGTSSVIEYIEMFKEYKMRCQIGEDEIATLCRLRDGLNPSIMNELTIRGVTSLDHAYEIARNSELAGRSLFVRYLEIHSIITSSLPSSGKPQLYLQKLIFKRIK